MDSKEPAYQIADMANLYTLPVLRRGVAAHYEGSIDKRGGNADWDWYLYQEENGEWVIFDYEGAGCLYNFVQHRYPDCSEPTFRFYFDGEKSPRFMIRHSQFGEVYPFTEPFSSRYIGPYDHGRGPIRVVRSFAPVPFEKGLKITSDVQLTGCDRVKDEGGWGHVIYHAYSEPQDKEGLTKGEPEEKRDPYEDLTLLWKKCGGPVLQFRRGLKKVAEPFIIEPGESRTIFEKDQGGLISGIRIRTGSYKREHLKALGLKAFWDHSADEHPDVDAGFGCLFHNELGYHGVRYLLAGMSADGEYYNFYPMPFEKSAVLVLVNTGSEPVRIDYAEIDYTEEWNGYYETHPFGYFKSSRYYTRKHTEGSDSVIAEISGYGQIAAAVITAFGKTPEDRADCEGDVRVYIDGIRTPQIESDGSESYACYGWGFETPPECNPSGGYDGHEHKDWSMARTLMGDWYPFLSGVRFQIESGGCNDVYMEHSGMIFYYGRDERKRKLLGEIVLGNSESEKEFSYLASGGIQSELTGYFEGDEDEKAVSLIGYCWEKMIEEEQSGVHSEFSGFTGSSFRIRLEEDTDYVILRRVSDQKIGRQKAEVLIDGRKVTEYPWYFADRNPYKRWLEDEFVIPSGYVKGKREIEVKIVPMKIDGRMNWNEYEYQIFGVKG